MNRRELGQFINRQCQEGLIYTPWGSPSVFFNRKQLSLNHFLLNEVASQLINRLPDNLNLLVGIGNGGTALAQAIAEKTNLSRLILGKDSNRLIRPDDVPRYLDNNLCLIDDILCHGTRALEARQILNLTSTISLSLLCVVFWNDNPYLKRLSDRGLKVISLFSGEELNSLGC